MSADTIGVAPPPSTSPSTTTINAMRKVFICTQFIGNSLDFNEWKIVWLLLIACTGNFWRVFRLTTGFQSNLKTFKVFFNTNNQKKKKKLFKMFVSSFFLYCYIWGSAYVTGRFFPLSNNHFNRHVFPLAIRNQKRKMLEYMEYLSQCDIYSSVNWIKNLLHMIAGMAYRQTVNETLKGREQILKKLKKTQTKLQTLKWSLQMYAMCIWCFL